MALEATRQQVEGLRGVWSCFEPKSGTHAERVTRYEALRDDFQTSSDTVEVKLGKFMARWQVGVFAGENVCGIPEDNLDLERWFRCPRRHQRHIHGHAHTGARLVRQGPTLMLVLDAHLAHPEPFTVEDLLPWRDARPPPAQVDAQRRYSIRRRARSRKRRPELLKELEKRYHNLD